MNGVTHDVAEATGVSRGGRRPGHRRAPPAAAAPVSVDELYAQLTKLAELRHAGLLTEDEFAAQKARLLAR